MRRNADASNETTHRVAGQWARYACCDAVNRGLAAFDGRIWLAERARRAHRAAGVESRLSFTEKSF
jgi:hypothetical protein